ncbi:MAG: glycosyltransferase [Ignavibacteriaceae bacterium]
MKKISFLIVNYFTSKYVKKLIESIYENILDFNYEILIHDNSCNEIEENKIKSLASEHVKIFIAANNYGFVKSNNFLSQRAEGDLLVLINPDTLLINNSLEYLFNYLFNNDQIALASPMLLNENMSYQVSFFKFPNIISLFMEHILLFPNNVYAYKTDKNKMQYCDVLKGACLTLKKEFLVDGHVFDEDFIMYSEETELCLRIKKLNKKVLYYPDAKIIHYGEKSSSQKEAKEYSLFHYYRSKLIFFKKYYKKNKMNLARFILLSSLFEKSIILYLFNKKENSRIHFYVFKKLRKDAKSLSNL